VRGNTACGVRGILQIGGPSKMTFGTSNLLVFFLAEGYMIIKGVLDSTRPGLHNGLRKKIKI